MPSSVLPLHLPAQPQQQVHVQHLAPWMLWQRDGAERAVRQLVQDEHLLAPLLAAIASAPEGETLQRLASKLRAVQQVVYRLASVAEQQALVQLIALVQAACEGGPHPGTPAPDVARRPAALPAPLQQRSTGSSVVDVERLLPPHLRQQQQQRCTGSSSGGMLHSQRQQQQQKHLQAVGNDLDYSDQQLLELLSSSGQKAAAQLPQQQQEQQHSTNSSRLAQGGLHNPPGGAVRLHNPPGGHNCFLNALVQCLWRLRPFCRQLCNLPGDVHPVVSALRGLLLDMDRAVAGWKEGQERPLLDCTALRQALVEKGFALQQEHDVCELLQTVLECVGAAQPPAASALQGSCGKLIDAQFGTLSTKKVLSRQHHYGRQQPHPACSRWEHLQKVNGNDLMSIAAASANAAGMGELLRAQLGCRDEFGFPIADAGERCCVAAPQALVLQLEYQVSRDEIWRVMQGIQPAIDIASWFAAGCAPASCKYRLSSIVVFYSGHFKTFCVDHVLGSWLLLDDTMIRMLDSWQAVVNMCVEGISRPYLLVYQAVDN